MKIKIAFIMSTLGTGGAEKVTSNILRYIDKEKFEPYLVILLKDNNDYLGNITDVNIINLGHTRTRNAIYDLIKTIRKLNPEILFSTLRGISFIISMIRPFLPRGMKYVYREENTPSISIKDTSTPKIYNFYYKTFYKKADIIICQSDYMKEDLINNYSFPTEKLVRIYNPVDFEGIQNEITKTRNPYKSIEQYKVIVVGRLSKQKGIDDLIHSINENKNFFKSKKVSVHVIGDGELKNELIGLAKKLNVDQYIKFEGRQSNPLDWMYNANLFLLPSRYEGLPNSLLEALAVGLEPIVTNHPGGTREVMKIANREASIVDELSWNESWFKKRKDAIDNQNLVLNFAVQKSVQQYEEIFLKVMDVKSN